MAAMTREERNKKRSDDRAAELFAKVRSFQSTLIETFRKVREEHWSCDTLLAWRNEWHTPYVNKLPGWARSEVTGAFDVLWDSLYRFDLTHCYDHPETGVPTPSKVLCDAGLASKLDTDTGHHYFKNADGTYSDRF